MNTVCTLSHRLHNTCTTTADPATTAAGTGGVASSRCLQALILLLLLLLLLLGLLHLAHEHGDGGGRREARLCGHHRNVPDGGEVVPQVHYIERQRRQGLCGRGVAAGSIEGGQRDGVCLLLLVLVTTASTCKKNQRLNHNWRLNMPICQYFQQHYSTNTTSYTSYRQREMRWRLLDNRAASAALAPRCCCHLITAQHKKPTRRRIKQPN